MVPNKESIEKSSNFVNCLNPKNKPLTPPGECSDDQVPPAVAAAPRPQTPYIREREAANRWAPA